MYSGGKKSEQALSERKLVKWRAFEKKCKLTVSRQFYVRLGAREQFFLSNQFHNFIIWWLTADHDWVEKTAL